DSGGGPFDLPASRTHASGRLNDHRSDPQYRRASIGIERFIGLRAGAADREREAKAGTAPPMPGSPARTSSERTFDRPAPRPHPRIQPDRAATRPEPGRPSAPPVAALMDGQGQSAPTGP